MRFPAPQRLPFRVLPVLLLAAWLIHPATAQDAPPNESADESEAKAVASPLAITELLLEPEAPTADTLCRLAVTLRNDGDRPVSGLRFVVKVQGTEVPVYRNQVFLDVVLPGESVEVQLYNFWVTETGRPLPANGELKVEVQLAEARWTKMEMEPTTMDQEASNNSETDDAETDDAETDDAETIETWTLLEPLAELPAPLSVTRKLAASR